MPSTNDDSSLVCPKAGVRLSYIIDEFYVECGGREALKGMTTKEVCERFIKSKTQAFQSSYCDLLKQKGHNAYGETAQVFISHAHECEFVNAIDALQWHLRDQLDTVIWFDLFSINQHQTIVWTVDWLMNTFKSSIQELGHCIVLLRPWNDPTPFTRAWCIFEVFCAAEAGNTFEIAMGESDRRQFLEDVREDPQNIDHMLGTIQAEKSLCSVENDRKRIFSVIKAAGGFCKINSMVFEQYRNWVISVAMDALDNCIAEGVERFHLLRVVGMLYLGQGKTRKAAPFLNECFDKRRSTLGENHPDTLMSMHNLAVLYDQQGEYDKAHPLYMTCLEKRKSIQGENHPDTLKSTNNLAVLYCHQGQYDQARPLFVECWEKRKSTLDENHKDTLASMNNLTSLYVMQGQYDKASDLYEECLEKRTSILGDNHPDTLSLMNSLAVLCSNQGQYFKARPLYEKCLKKRTSILGTNHPDTLQSMHNLALLYYNQGQDIKARLLYAECLEHRKSILGESHPDTLHSMNNLALLYYNQDQYDQARPLYEECLKTRQSILGENHPDTLLSMNNLAALYDKQSGYKKVALCVPSAAKGG